MSLVALFVWVLVSLWKVHGCTAAEPPFIIIQPNTSLVPFNLNGNATFECEVNGTLIWQVGSIQLSSQLSIDLAAQSDIHIESDPAMLFKSALKIFIDDGTPSGDRNGTVVRCIAEGTSILESAVSDEAFLYTFAIPEKPNVRLTTTSTDPDANLTLAWDPPSNTPPGVDTSYLVEIKNLSNNASYPGFPVNVTTTSVVIPETADCMPFQFSVTSMNDAGESPRDSLIDTIPLSPNVIPISESLANDTVVTFDQDGNAVITLTFSPAVTCSTNFMVETYNISIEGIADEVPVPAEDISDDVIITSLTSLNGLVNDVEYTLTVEACSELICRSSDPVTVATSGVMTGELVFLEEDNRAYLSCTFNTGTTATGCSFSFTRLNETEVFNVTRVDQSSPSASLCVLLENRVDAYDVVNVRDMEEGGDVGDLIVPMVTNLLSFESFNELCSLPPPTSEDDGLSDGAIAGIVLGVAAAVIIVAVIIVILIIVFFRVRREVRVDREGNIDISRLPLMAEPTSGHPTGLMRMLSGRRIESDTAEAEEATPLEARSGSPDLQHEAVGKLDCSDPKNIRLNLNPKVMRKILKWHRESRHDHGSPDDQDSTLILFPAGVLKSIVPSAETDK